MKITKIYLRQPKNQGKIKAYADIVLDDCLIIRNLKLIETKEKMIVCFPARKIKKNFKDIVHPINSELRNYITDTLISEYKN